MILHWTTSEFKMVNVLPRPSVRLMTPVYVVGRIYLEIILIGQDQMVERLVLVLDQPMIIPMAQIKVKNRIIKKIINSYQYYHYLD